MVFTSRNLEVSQGERIHLSSLALLCYCHQSLLRTSLSKDHFDARFLSFLTGNVWYEPSLAVRQCLETGQFSLLASLATVRGLEAEVGRGLAHHLQQATGQSAALLEQYFTCLPASESQGLTACLLLPGLLSALLPDPATGRALSRALTTLLPHLSPSQLTAVLHSSSPSRPDLQPLLHPELHKGAAEGMPQFASALLELFCVACLTLLKAKAEAGSPGPSYSRRLLAPVALPAKEQEQPTVTSCVLAAGYSHSLLLGRSSLTSWGGAGAGCLGTGAINTSLASATQIPLVRALPGLRVAQVAAGKHHSLALTEAGVYAWGDNRFGQLGVGVAALQSPSPRLVPGLCGVVGVAAGQFHCLARDSEGRLLSWGWGVHGQLGHGGIEDWARPGVVRALARHRVVGLAAGYAHSAVLTAKGRVFTFGCSLFGQLGSGGTSKAVLPREVELGAPCRLLASGYFHCVALVEGGSLLVWGSNPQVLRLEAQQRKKERQAAWKAEAARQEEVAVERKLREAAEEDGSSGPAMSEEEEEELQSSSFPSISQPVVDLASEEHLVPTPLPLPPHLGAVAAVSCGSQHTAVLSTQGRLYCLGRSLEGQLGVGSRSSTKVPTMVTALQDDCVLAVAAGADFTLALTDSGTVFGWGSNTSGQLGKPPIETENKGDNSKVLVMKTTKRVIRLQHGLQNSCDMPKPVQGLIRTGVYSEEVPDSASPALASFYSRLTRGSRYPPIEPVFHSAQLQTFLHTTIELFPDLLDTAKLLRKCLMLDNPLAAAKISLGERKLLQAFDLSLQSVLRSEPEGAGSSIFHCFLHYCRQPWAQPRQKAELFGRLVNCWQERGGKIHRWGCYSFCSCYFAASATTPAAVVAPAPSVFCSRLEQLLLEAADQDLLHTMIFRCRLEQCT